MTNPQTEMGLEQLSDMHVKDLRSMRAKSPRPSDMRMRYKDIPDCEGGGCYARVWLPEDSQEGTSMPVVMMIHGGGFTFGDDVNVPAPEIDFLNANNTAVVSVQYRLAPHASLPEMVEDLVDAYEWIVRRLADEAGLKPIGKIAIAGWSAGATLTVLAGHYITKRGLPSPHALMATYGIYDYALMALNGRLEGGGLSQEELKMLSNAKAGGLVAGFPIEKVIQGGPIVNSLQTWFMYMYTSGLLMPFLTSFDPYLIAEYDPVQFLQAGYPPIALVGASGDELVLPEHTRSFDRKLTELGIQHQLLWCEGMPHGAADFVEDNVSSFEKYQVWFRSAIEPSLKFVLSKIR